MDYILCIAFITMACYTSMYQFFPGARSARMSENYMAITLSSLKRGQDIRPPRIILYGTKGIGKTTFASLAPDPVFLFTEEGHGLLSADRLLISHWDEAFEFLRMLYTEDHTFKTLVIDSLDWLERLCHEKVKKVHGERIFFDYGKGFKFAGDLFDEFVRALDKLRLHKNMMIILIAHSKIKRFEAPDVPPFERYMLDLHERAASVVEEWCDVELFATQKVFTTKTDVGFGQNVVQGVGSGERVMYTEERPAYSAKNRYNLPHELPMPKENSYAPFRAALIEAIAKAAPASSAPPPPAPVTAPPEQASAA